MRRNALFSFHPGLLTGKQRRSRGRQPYNRKAAGMVRKARKHRYDWVDDKPFTGRKDSGAMSALTHDVALALMGQGFSRAAAKKAARSARGNDFETMFRSALTKAKGNPMSKKKTKKKKKGSARKRRMPAALARYWAKKRAKKKVKRNRRKRNSRRVRTKTIVRTVRKIVYRNRRKTKKKRNRTRKPRRAQLRQVNIPGRITPRQAKAIRRAIARAHPGRRVVLKQR
jgi:hypothetical protein